MCDSNQREQPSIIRPQCSVTSVCVRSSAWSRLDEGLNTQLSQSPQREQKFNEFSDCNTFVSKRMEAVAALAGWSDADINTFLRHWIRKNRLVISSIFPIAMENKA